ncbi:pyridoxamine 5'-phosphate oxidase-related, FMN-binding protein [Hyaloraphidium curvatum]|nr:pyridoxamine 5'-phosphate oxidase-related, FMN-binding protein [Hyaloraphidium curvatum]
MTRPVPADGIAAASAAYPSCFLITTSPPPSRAHPVSCRPAVSGTTARIADAGKTTRANIADRQEVVLLWPAKEEGGMSLIADGKARVEGNEVVVELEKGILHRAA